MKHEVPYTIGYELDRALIMLKDYDVVVEETSTPFQDKIEERRNNTLIVVRQLKLDNCVKLTVSRFK